MLSAEWKEFFKDYRNPALHEAVNRVYSSEMVYPKRENLFRAFEFFKPEETRVVILGQDPYPQPGNACGLAFAVPDTQPVPGSLQHIFAEIDYEFGVERPDRSTSLTQWAEQGVLLLNTILTVRHGSPMSHCNIGWQAFTDYAIRKLSDVNENMVFLLWGNPSGAKASLVNPDKHLIIKTTHPSGLSWGKLADGSRQKWNSFWGSGQFVQCNQYLEEHGYKPITW